MPIVRNKRSAAPRPWRDLRAPLSALARHEMPWFLVRPCPLWRDRVSRSTDPLTPSPLWRGPVPGQSVPLLCPPCPASVHYLRLSRAWHGTWHGACTVHRGKPSKKTGNQVLTLTDECFTSQTGGCNNQSVQVSRGRTPRWKSIFQLPVKLPTADRSPASRSRGARPWIISLF